MTIIKTGLAAMFIALFVYTLIAIGNDGLNLIPPFLGAIASLTWVGQFTLDFSFLLIIVATWIAWRHEFSATGLLLALLMVGGVLYLVVYLLVILSRANNNIEVVMLGAGRAARSKA